MPFRANLLLGSIANRECICVVALEIILALGRYLDACPVVDHHTLLVKVMIDRQVARVSKIMSRFQ